MVVISIIPNDAGWQVESETLAAPLMFLSGGKAEDAGKRLAHALTERGLWVEIRVHTKEGGLFGRFVCPPVGAGSQKARARMTVELEPPARPPAPQAERPPLAAD